ncbi:MAG: 3-dehydroquinate synthase [Candidatus Firestonebacteria bacterium]
MKQNLLLNIKFFYDVIFTRDIFSQTNKSLINLLPEDKKSKIIVFIDKGLIPGNNYLVKNIIKWSQKYRKNVDLVADPYLVQGGEQIKNGMKSIEKINKLILKSHLCRHSFVMIIGGGAVLDAVGFAATITHRGLRQIRIPTTVLSQADSGVGVKNGINQFGIKNYYGTFYPPFGVINDYNFLRTLSQRDWISGISEAFKVAIIKDIIFLDFLSKNAKKLFNRDQKIMEEMIYKCARLHINHIKNSGDPFEFGLSRPLDFGHWSAHRLESLSKYKLRHGEAVGIGIALDLHCATRLGLIKKSDCEYVCYSMEQCGIKLWHPALKYKTIYKGLEQFREHLGGNLSIPMPDGFGKQINIQELPKKIILESIKEMKKHKICIGKREHI